MKHAQASIVNSTRIETYWSAGERARVLLFPGIFGGSWIWQDVAAGLAGHGYEVSTISEPLGLNPAIGDVPKLISWATELIQTMYDEPVVIAGNSMGALIAMEIAAHHP